MSPGINDHPRNTGTLPKSNRRSDRNRERDRSAVNQNSMYSRIYASPPTQHSNNLSKAREQTEPRVNRPRSSKLQFDWHSVGERQTSTTPTAAGSSIASTSRAAAKNSNARSTYSSASSYDLADHLGPYSSHSRLYPNLYPREDSWLKMTPPADSRGQSPPNLSMKPTNTDKMPERGQVEGRLNQIREYIKVTSTMMDSLSQSSDPRAQAQHEKLGRMVEDLYDSEQKLTKLLENCQKYWSFNENGDVENGERSREQELVKKIEESQRKLAQLQEHQAQLAGMQLSVRERLNEARQAQRLICVNSDEDNELVPENEVREPSNHTVNLGNVELLERETEALRGKLQLLENKKRHMDHLVQELQAVEMSERASCSSEGSRSTAQRDKVAELEAMKAQLKHLKALMNNAMQNREADNEPIVSEPEHDDDVDVQLMNNHNDEAHEIMTTIENDVNIDTNSYNDLDEVRPKLSSDPPSVQQIQAVTRELKEQQQLLQAARTELRRLKQTSTNATPSVTKSSTPPPTLIEKKQSNHTASNNDLRLNQNKRRQIEDFMRKDQSHASSINQNGAPDWSSRRGSNSQHSHMSTPANLWPPPTANIAPTHEHSVDAMSVADNLLEMGSQPPIMNGFGGNYWEMPNLMNQAPQGTNVASAEYYRQLLLGSQSLQLQMMSTTIQQCCQLVWNQQREMQSMKAAITQLQAQLRQSQSRASNNLDLPEEHSNLGRAAAQQQQQQQHFGSLDPSTLPPSSSLPNLVSLPSTSHAPPSVVSTPASCQQQLNNQVPPGNRANNYWDNFRSYSRQNLLSGSSKTTTEVFAGASAHASSSTNTASGISSHANNKCNRHVDLENSPSAPLPDAQYSVNLQQEHDPVTSSVPHNNFAPNNEEPQHQQQQQQQPSQQQQQNHQQSVNDVDAPLDFENEAAVRDNEPSSSLGKKVRSDVKVLLKRCLKVLESRPENGSPVPSDGSNNSSDWSDNESEAGAGINEAASVNNGNMLIENHLPDFIEAAASAQAYTSPLPEFLEHEVLDMLPFENNENSLQPVSSTTSNHNDITETDVTRPENSNNNQLGFHFGLHYEELNADDERDRYEYVMLEHAHNSTIRSRRCSSNSSSQR